MREWAEALYRAGVSAERDTTAPFDYEEAWQVSGVCLGAIDTLFRSRGARWLRRLRAPVLSRIGSRHPLMRGLIAGSSLRPAVVSDALARREALIDELESFLAARDAWIVPVFPTPAFTHRGAGQPIEVDGEPMPQIMANLLHNVVFNMTGHPVTTMPAGLSARGLPIGVQMVGRRWQEMALLDVAEQMAKRTGGYRLPPDTGEHCSGKP